MFKNLRAKLSPKQVVYFKLATWTMLLTWMLFFFIFSIIMAQRAAYIVPAEIWGSETWASALHWILPIWIVFTSMLIIYFTARYANKKLRRK